jgi:hypothetical protein
MRLQQDRWRQEAILLPPFFLQWSVNRDQGRWRASQVSKLRPGVPGNSESQRKGFLTWRPPKRCRDSKTLNQQG